MDGRNLAIGAVSNVTVARNAVSLARLVMEHSRHVFLSGKNAQQMTMKKGLNGYVLLQVLELMGLHDTLGRT